MSATQTQTASIGNVVGMDQYTHLAVTPGMGEEFPGDLQLSELLKAPNADTLIQDLAVLSELTFTEVFARLFGHCRYST
jgi:hypothetical protein